MVMRSNATEGQFLILAVDIINEPIVYKPAITGVVVLDGCLFGYTCLY